MRIIDAYRAIDMIDEWLDSVATVLVWKWLSSYGELIECIEDTPTLTPPNEWVSVENALPPNMDDVLVVVQNNGECWTVTGYYSNTSNVWYAMLNGQDTQMDVLWWMPLPAPPDRRPPEGEENT